MSKTIFFSVGEPSGDQHAARVARELKSIAPDLKLRGFAGTEMQAAGVHCDRDLTEHAVVGILEVLPKLREFFSFVDEAEAIFQSGEVDLVVLVDFPGFNWHIAKRAKQYGIPVIYYCPPQLWAWGGWRIRKLKRTVDHVLAVLPIEQEFYEKNQVPVTFVGHPFFDAVHEQKLDASRMRGFEESRTEGQKLVAVLPGSRNHEVHKNWPIMLESIRRLRSRHADARFLVAAYRQQQLDWCREQLAESGADLPIDFYRGATSEIIEAADCAMMVSGSVSLELMARQTPAVVVYRVSRSMYIFGKCMIGIDSMSLPNLMAKTEVFPEFVSVGSVNPAVDFLVKHTDKLLSEDLSRQTIVDKLGELREKYAQPGASLRAAQFLLEKLGSPTWRAVA